MLGAALRSATCGQAPSTTLYSLAPVRKTLMKAGLGMAPTKASEQA
jgi:hypothetical protein